MSRGTRVLLEERTRRGSRNGAGSRAVRVGRSTVRLSLRSLSYTPKDIQILGKSLQWPQKVRRHLRDEWFVILRAVRAS